MIRELSALLFLGVSGISDVRRKSIPAYLPILGVIIALIIEFYASDLKLKELLISLTPGIGFLIISFATSEKLGLGDGLTIISLGLLCGVWDTLTTLIYASLSSGVVALFLIAFKKKNRNYAMPYLPFLLCGLVLTFLIKRT